MINYFTWFKALCHFTEGKRWKQDVDYKKGINFNSFRFGIPEMAMENETFVRKLFKLANIDDVSARMTWENFLIAMRALSCLNKTYNIDVVFNLIGGKTADFSYNEVSKVCESYFKSMDADLWTPSQVLSKPEKNSIKIKRVRFY